MGTRITLSILVILAVLGVSTLALAAGGGAPGEFQPGPMLRHLLNLVLLITLLTVALKTPVRDFLSFRRTTVKEQLDEAWNAKSDAEARYGELQGRLDNFADEIDLILTRVREDAETERARIIAQAERSAAQMEAAAERAVEEELRRVRSELRAEAIDLALEMAEAAIGGAVADEDHQRLTKNYLSRMQETPRS